MAAQNERDQMRSEELSNLFNARASMYGLLARLYRNELELDQLNELKRMKFPVGTGNKTTDEGFVLMHDYLKEAWEGSVTELKIDFSRTFIGSGVSGYSAAYPYESVYTSDRRLLGREARGEVLQYYRNNNLKKGAWNDMEDHIALELEFMQIMGGRTRDALEKEDEDEALNYIRCQHDFVRNHLNNWLPMIAGDMLKFSETKLYQGLAKVTLGYCEDDEALLREILENAPESPVEIAIEGMDAEEGANAESPEDAGVGADEAEGAGAAEGSESAEGAEKAEQE